MLYGLMSNISSFLSHAPVSLNYYLCGGYKNFFLHIRKYLRTMTQLLENGLPVSYIIDALKGPLVIKLDEVKKAEE